MQPRSINPTPSGWLCLRNWKDFMHSTFTDWMAVEPECRCLVLSKNPALLRSFSSVIQKAQRQRHQSLVKYSRGEGRCLSRISLNVWSVSSPCTFFPLMYFTPLSKISFHETKYVEGNGRKQRQEQFNSGRWLRQKGRINKETADLRNTKKI